MKYNVQVMYVISFEEVTEADSTHEAEEQVSEDWCVPGGSAEHAAEELETLIQAIEQNRITPIHIAVATYATATT